MKCKVWTGYVWFNIGYRVFRLHKNTILGPLLGVNQMCGDRSKCTIVPDTQLSGCVSSINTFIVGETLGLLLKFWLNLDSIFRSVVWIV